MNDIDTLKHKLPKHWQVKRLGEVCEISIGKTPPRKDKTYWDINKETNNVWISISDLQYSRNKFVYDSKEYISDKGVSISRIVKKGTLLLSFKLTIGKLAFAGVDLFTNEAIAALPIVKEDLLDKFYLYYYLLSFDWDRITEGESKVKGKTLNKQKLYKIPIPIPPLAEQKRIVSILDKVFAEIDKAKDNAEKNLKNAKELFESYSNNIFENRGKHWEVKRLGEVCIVERGSSPRPIKQYLTDEKDGINWIKIGDTKNVDKYIYKTAQKITKEGAKKSRYVRKGDLILSNSMSYGRPYIMMTDGCIHDGWFVLRLNDTIIPDYLYQLLISKFVREQFNKLASGAVVKNISSDLIKKVTLLIPPLSEQKKIVKELDKLKEETRELQEIYQKKIDDLEELRRSILEKAFKGEL